MKLVTKTDFENNEGESWFVKCTLLVLILLEGFMSRLRKKNLIRISSLFIMTLLVPVRANQFPVSVDHLVPVEPNVDEYSIAWRRALLHPEFECICMTLRPAFDPEMAVAVSLGRNSNSADSLAAPSTQAPTNYIVTLRVASTNIWSTFHKPPAGQKHHPFSVSESKTTLDVLTGEKCFKAWKLMLKRTKYRDKPWIDCDGYFAEFRFYEQYGEIWSPPQGICLDFVEIGKALISLCKVPEKAQPAIIRDLNFKLDILIEKLEKT